MQLQAVACMCPMNIIHPHQLGCPNRGRLNFIRWLLISEALNTDLLRASLLVFSILRLLPGFWCLAFWGCSVVFWWLAFWGCSVVFWWLAFWGCFVVFWCLAFWGCSVVFWCLAFWGCSVFFWCLAFWGCSVIFGV